MPLDQFYEDGEESLQLTDYELEPLREDEELIPYWGRHVNHAGASSVFLLAPVLTRSSLETLKKIEHECSFKDALGAGWPVRPITLSWYDSWFQFPIARQDF